ncbi:MAG: response regulator [Bacteroidales bacterium]|jgi:DNA-binding NtrC family response regulator|nr:response regulator [Bacteroidales bacterium]NPV36791.1 response regulator [Bacteroidales bacterium]
MRVLILDSSVPILNRLSAALGRNNNRLQLAVACTASEAYEELANHTYDLVVFDLVLPDDPGMRFLQILVKEFPLAVPVIYTSDLSAEVERSCRKMGCNFFFRKPEDHEKLVKMIIKLTNRID